MAEEKGSLVLKGVVPWGIHPLQKFVQTELESRPKKYAGTGVGGKTAIRSAWARVCSNGVPTDITHPAHGSKAGFVFFGPNLDSTTGFPVNFNSTFGFNKSRDSVIGYTTNGGLHYVAGTTLQNRPPPGIISIENEFYGAGSSFPGLCRKSTIKWKCFSVDQLEYLTPYLMSLKVSMTLEWGWNDYDPASLIDLTSDDQILALFRFPMVKKDTAGQDQQFKSVFERNRESSGNYDCHVGIINEYGYTMDSQGNYEGFTVVVAPTAFFGGNSATNQVAKTKDEKDANSLKKYMKDEFDSIQGWFSDGKLTVKEPVVLSDAARAQAAQFGNTTVNSFQNTAFYKFLTSHKNKDDYRVFRFTSDDNVDGKPSTKFWINFRLLESILNWFTTIKLDKGITLLNFDFSNVIISGQPLLKAVSPSDKSSNLGVIVPNKFAPRMMRIFDSSDADNKHFFTADQQNSGKAYTGTSGNLGNISQPDKKFEETAKNLKEILRERGLVDNFDDLALVTKAVNSFPMFGTSDIAVTSDPNNTQRTSAAGYWGYLGDIYVSNDTIKRAVENNDTVHKILKQILDEVSIAGSGIWEFQINQNNNGITVTDNLYCPVYDDKSSAMKEIIKFAIGATEKSAFNEYSMNIKMSQEVALNAMLGAKSSVDPKRVDAFVQSDRLFGIPGSFTMNEDDPAVKKTPAQLKTEAAAEKAAADATRTKQNYRASDEGFVVWHHKDGKNYYFNEKDSSFMREIIQIKSKNSNGVSPGASPLFPGTEFTFTMPGIAGFNFMSLFALDAVPAPYKYDRAIFQVTSVQHSIQNNNWKTSVTAKVRPLSVTA